MSRRGVSPIQKLDDDTGCKSLSEIESKLQRRWKGNFPSIIKDEMPHAQRRQGDSQLLFILILRLVLQKCVLDGIWKASSDQFLRRVLDIFHQTIIDGEDLLAATIAVLQQVAFYR